jgi:hypothetical protein
MPYNLYEYDNGRYFGLASEEEQARYTKALQEGKSYILRGYHGYELKVVVRKDRTIEEEKALFGCPPTLPVDKEDLGGGQILPGISD